MKAQSDYFRRKNSKQGLALSTAMAICIVLAILVAVLVSMATLNITTTQATINQREAYIQAKSALAFVESYYSQNDIPGKNKAGESNALFVFKDTVVSKGAEVYLTMEDGVPQLEDGKVEKLKEECVDTYVEVKKMGDYLDLTANCKYGDNNSYVLAKEFNLGSENEAKLPYWEGNLSYTPPGDTRYLRIHVRTNPAVFNNKDITGTEEASAPYLFTWYNVVNTAEGDEVYGRSSTVNKMSNDEEDYPDVQNGKWGSTGPEGECAMAYEGNGWYVTEVKVGTKNNVNFVNAIVTKADSHRDNTSKSDYGLNNQQTWELFGIPLPNDDNTGANNGTDVYITLNRNDLHDARYIDPTTGESTHWTENKSKGIKFKDEFTYIFENNCGSDINKFAEFCGSWYTVYTKKDVSTMHYRVQGTYEDTTNPGGDFEYEGYGWYRCTYSSDKWDSTIEGYTFGSANTVSENEYGKEIVKEGFVCVFSDGSKALYATEAEANEAFAKKGEGKKAGEYLTVNVKSTGQPVNDKVPTTITYDTKWDTSTPTSTPTPDPEPESNPANTELEFQKLSSDEYHKEYALIGSADADDADINDWGRKNGSTNKYEYIKDNKFEQIETGVYQYRMENCKATTYRFQVIELLKDSGDIYVKNSFNGWNSAYKSIWLEKCENVSIGNDSDENIAVTVPKDNCTLTITFTTDGNRTYVKCEEGALGDYAVYGDCNAWGTRKSDGTVYSDPDFAATDLMTYITDPESENYKKFVYVASDKEDQVGAGDTFRFKIVKRTAESGAIPDEAKYPSAAADDNFEIVNPNSETGYYVVTVIFDPENNTASATFAPAPEASKRHYEFFNGKNKDADEKDTEFTAWSEIYLTVISGGTAQPSVKVDSVSADNYISINVPEDADEFYLSNKDSSESSASDFRCTRRIPLTTAAGSMLIPTYYTEDSASASSDNKSWEIYIPGSNVEELHDKTGTMVYSGSVQTNFYDIPLVKVLSQILGGGKYAFAAYPYKSSDSIWDSIGGGVNKVTFDKNQYVTYQGEKYYYQPSNGYSNTYSFLIIRDHTGNKGGVLLENHLALMTDVIGGVQTNMQNRGGGMFTSDSQTYAITTGSTTTYKELTNYGGYTPNWYTFKVPVTEEVKIKQIKGVVTSSTEINISSSYITPAKVNDYYRQPIYISQEYENSTDDTLTVKYYTFNTNIGSVDMDEHSKVSVYFANDNGAFSKVSVHAYNLRNEKEDKELSIDTSDGDGHNYYSYPFDEGKYCYFVFYDPTSSSDGSFEKATKKTSVLYLTGDEDVNTHEFDILALNNTSTTFTKYVHPRTTALYAAISLESAVQASRIPENYSYNAATNTYKELNNLEMSNLVTEASKAREYANNGDGGVWKSAKSSNYADLVKAVQEYVSAILKTRIYIAEEVPDPDPSSSETNFTGSGRVFKEGAYKDDTFRYKDIWVNTLTNSYDNAMSVYSTNAGAQTDPTKLRNYVAELESLIAYPLTEPGSKAVTIAVCDKVIPKKNDKGEVIATPGGWGKTNIHLYNLTTDNKWDETNYELYDTTQTDGDLFYAYVFKLTTESHKFKISKGMPADDEETKNTAFELKEGGRYVFYTATGELKDDDSNATYRVPFDNVNEDNYTRSYNQFETRDDESMFTLYFMYDTKVKAASKGLDYTIRAGYYTISNSYVGFEGDNADIKDKKGIDLFTTTARDFFTKPSSYGMSKSSSTDYTTWSSNVPDSSDDVDIMCDDITLTPTASAATSSNKKVGFRYNTTKGSDTLTLNQDIELRGGTVTVAANKIVLNGHEFSMDAKTVVFKTDTVLVNGSTQITISHGTYALNKTESGTSFDVKLSSTGTDDDWRDHYTLISYSSSALRGGYYIEPTR